MAVRLTIPKPAQGDQPWMTVTCTPDTTSVEFFDEDTEARDAARLNLVPTASVYVGQITHQGEHVVRGSSSHIAISIHIDPELRAALRNYNGAGNRNAIADTLRGLLLADLSEIVADYQGRRTLAAPSTDEETTHQGGPPDGAR